MRSRACWKKPWTSGTSQRRAEAPPLVTAPSPSAAAKGAERKAFHVKDELRPDGGAAPDACGAAARARV